jgi:hypothetical protein
VEFIEPTVPVELGEELTLETTGELDPEVEVIELPFITDETEAAETGGAFAAIACWAA